MYEKNICIKLNHILYFYFDLTEDNIVDLPSLRIVKESSISGPVLMEALVIDVPVDFCRQQNVSDTVFDGVSLTEDTTLANKSDDISLCENSFEYFSDHLSNSNSKKDVFFSASETTPKNASSVLRPASMKSSSDDEHQSFRTPKLFMSDSDDQILTQLLLDEQRAQQTSQNVVKPLARSESNNTEEEVSETLADLENELPHNYCVAEILTQSDEDGLFSSVLNKIRGNGIETLGSEEEDDVSKIIYRPDVDEFLKYMKIILEGAVVKMYTHESCSFSDTPTELERSIQALHSLAWKFIEETERADVTELDKCTADNVSGLMSAINAGLLALEQIDDPFGVSDNVLNEIQSSIRLDLETLNNKDLAAWQILEQLSDQIANFTDIINGQVAVVTEQRIMAVLRNTIGTTLMYVKTLQQNGSKVKCVNPNSLAPLFSLLQPLETILNAIFSIEEGRTADESQCNYTLKQMLIPPISSIAFSLENLNTALKNENPEDDQELKDVFDRINDCTIQFTALASQGTESKNLAECFISFTKPINDLCFHLKRLGRSTENIVSSDYGSDDKLLIDFETLFDELMMDIDTLVNNVNVVRDCDDNVNPLGSLLEPLQDMKIGLFQVNQVLLSNQTGSNMSFEVVNCFEHLSQQLVQLNKCIVNQSIVEETDKEIPFESSIKLMQSILFDDAIDDLGVNGILFGSVMKPLLQLQNLIVSKMASVESDLSFSEHTDVTGGAGDTQSLSQSLSNNAQTILDKVEKDNLKQNANETSLVNKEAKETDIDNNRLKASTSKNIKDSTNIVNDTKNDLPKIKRGVECDIGVAFKDEEPNIVTSEDDRENSCFEGLFDETDLETTYDFVKDEYFDNIGSNVENKLVETNVDSVIDENYDLIPKHILESLEDNFEQESSTDLIDELQETLKIMSEGKETEIKEFNFMDSTLVTNILPEGGLECMKELNGKTSYELKQPIDTVLIDNPHKNSIITSVIDFTEKAECLHSDKLICKDKIIASNANVDPKITILEIADGTLESVNVQEIDNTGNKENELAINIIKLTSSGQNEVKHDNTLKTMNIVENVGATKLSDLKNQNETLDIEKLENVNSSKLLDIKNIVSSKANSQEITSSENQYIESVNVSNANEIIEDETVYPIQGIGNNLNVNRGGLITDKVEKLDILMSHADVTSLENIKEKLVIVDNNQLPFENVEIKTVESNINTELKTIVHLAQACIENQFDKEVNKQPLVKDECNIELNTSQTILTDDKKDKKKKKLIIEELSISLSKETLKKSEKIMQITDQSNLQNKSIEEVEKIEEQKTEKQSSIQDSKMVKDILPEPPILNENDITLEIYKNDQPDKIEIVEEMNVNKLLHSDLQSNINLISKIDGEKISPSKIINDTTKSQKELNDGDNYDDFKFSEDRVSLMESLDSILSDGHSKKKENDNLGTNIFKSKLTDLLLKNEENNLIEELKLSDNITPSEDNVIKECVTIKSEVDLVNKSDVSSNYSSNNPVIISSDTINENSINVSLVEIIYDEENINKSKNSIDDLKEAIVSENDNKINDDVHEFASSVSTEKVESLLVTFGENNALISNEVITAGGTQSVEPCKFKEIQLEVKYADDDSIYKATYDQKTILQNKDNDKHDEKTREDLDNSVVGILSDDEEKPLRTVDIPKGNINETTSDSLKVLIEQNTALMIDEVISADSVITLEKPDVRSFKYAEEKNERMLQLLQDSEQVTVLENRIDSEEKNKEHKVGIVDAKNARKEIITPKDVDRIESMNEQYKIEEISDISKETTEIKNRKPVEDEPNSVKIQATDICESSQKTNNVVETDVKVSSEISIESGIGNSIIGDDFDATITESDTVKTNTDRKIGIDCLSDQNNRLTEYQETVEKDSIERKLSILVEESVTLNSAEIVAADCIQVMSDSHLRVENADDNLVDHTVAECQTVALVDDVVDSETAQLENVTNSDTIIFNVKESNIVEENDETCELNSIEYTSIVKKTQVLIEECNAVNNEEVIVIDSTQLLKIDNVHQLENINEKRTEHLAESIQILEPVIRKSPSVDNNENIEENTRAIQEKVISKDTEVIEYTLDDTNDTMSPNTIDSKKSENTVFGELSVLKSSSLDSSKSEFLLNTNDADKTVTRSIDDNLSTTQIIDGNLNLIDQQNDTLKTESLDVRNDDKNLSTDVFTQVKQNVKDSLVNLPLNESIDDMDVDKEKIKVVTKIEEHKTETNDRVDVSALEKCAHMGNDIIMEEDITDLSFKEKVSTFALKPKLHRTEQLAANQTECVMLESAIILKQDECDNIKNITNHALVEHQLNIAVIGYIVLDYENLKETELNEGDRKDCQKIANITPTIDEHSNEAMCKNIDVLKAPCGNVDLKKNVAGNETTDDFMEELPVISEISTLNDLDELTIDLDTSTRTISERSNNDTLHKELEKKTENEPTLIADLIKPTETGKQSSISMSSSKVKNDTVCEIDKSLEDGKVNDMNEKEHVKEKSITNTKISPSPVDASENPNNNKTQVKTKNSDEEDKKISENKETADKLETKSKQQKTEDKSVLTLSQSKVPEEIGENDSIINELENNKNSSIQSKLSNDEKEKEKEKEKKKHGSIKKKTSLQPQDKNSPSCDKIKDTSNYDQKLEEKSKADSDVTKDKNIFDEELKTEIKDDQSAFKEKSEEKIKENIQTEICEIHKINENESEKSAQDKIVGENDMQKQGSRKNRKSSTKSPSPDKLKIKSDTDRKVNEQIQDELKTNTNIMESKIVSSDVLSSSLKKEETQDDGKDNLSIKSEKTLVDHVESILNDNKTNTYDEKKNLNVENHENIGEKLEISNEGKSDKKERGSRKKKKSPQTGKKSPSPEKSNKTDDIISKNDPQTDEETKTDVDITKKQIVSNGILSSPLKKDKSDQDSEDKLSAQLKTIISDDVNSTLNDSKKYTPDKKKTENHKKEETKSEISIEDKSDQKQQGSIKKKTGPLPRDKKSQSPDKLNENDDSRPKSDQKTEVDLKTNTSVNKIETVSSDKLLSPSKKDESQEGRKDSLITKLESLTTENIKCTLSNNKIKTSSDKNKSQTDENNKKREKELELHDQVKNDSENKDKKRGSVKEISSTQAKESPPPIKSVNETKINEQIEKQASVDNIKEDKNISSEKLQNECRDVENTKKIINISETEKMQSKLQKSNVDASEQNKIKLEETSKNVKNEDENKLIKVEKDSQVNDKIDEKPESKVVREKNTTDEVLVKKQGNIDVESENVKGMAKRKIKKDKRSETESMRQVINEESNVQSMTLKESQPHIDNEEVFRSGFDTSKKSSSGDIATKYSSTTATVVGDSQESKLSSFASENMSRNESGLKTVKQLNFLEKRSLDIRNDTKSPVEVTNVYDKNDFAENNSHAKRENRTTNYKIESLDAKRPALMGGDIISKSRDFESSRAVKTTSISAVSYCSNRSSPSTKRHYLDVTDAYSGAYLKPSTYRSLTPEPMRFSNVITRHSSERDLRGGRILAYRSVSPCPTEYRRLISTSFDSFSSKNLSPATVYRCPSEIAFRNYRSDDESLLYWRHGELRKRRGSDSFLHGLGSRDGYSGWKHSERSKTQSWTAYADDLNRTKVTKVIMN